MRDLLSNIQLKKVISPQNVTGDTPIVGTIIDRLGYDSLTFVIQQGTNDDAAATFAVLVEDGDDSDLVDDGAAVADTELVSQTAGTAPETAAAFNQGDDDEVRSIGYRGRKRYVRLTITPTGVASPGNTFLSACAVLGHAAQLPVSHAAG